MNFFIKFVPHGDPNKEVWRLPIQAKDEAEAEQFALQLAITLDAEKSDSYPISVMVYEKFESGYENGNSYIDSLYSFHVEWS